MRYLSKTLALNLLISEENQKMCSIFWTILIYSRIWISIDEFFTENAKFFKLIINTLILKNKRIIHWGRFLFLNKIRFYLKIYFRNIIKHIIIHYLRLLYSIQIILRIFNLIINFLFQIYLLKVILNIFFKKYFNFTFHHWVKLILILFFYLWFFGLH